MWSTERWGEQQLPVPVPYTTDKDNGAIPPVAVQGERFLHYICGQHLCCVFIFIRFNPLLYKFYHQTKLVGGGCVLQMALQTIATPFQLLELVLKIGDGFRHGGGQLGGRGRSSRGVLFSLPESHSAKSPKDFNLNFFAGRRRTHPVGEFCREEN